MAELLLFAHDHSTDLTLGATQRAQLPALYDLITYQATGWKWGTQELTNPWFRILLWPTAVTADLDKLLQNQIPIVVNGNATTKWQYRGFFLNVPTGPAALGTWFTDATRVTQKLVFPSAVVTVAQLTVARPTVAAAAL